MERWDKKGLPHKGWRCDDVIDLGGDGPMDDDDYATCEMCDKERIRYVHVMSHPRVPKSIDVGCVCAGKMSGDYEGARQRERVLRNKAARRSNWLKRNWRVSAKGNPYLNIDDFNIGVHKSGAKWGYRIGKTFSADRFPTEDEAKLALFEAFSTMKEPR